MVRITEDLIRRRAEHNECVLSTLEEVSLHQQDIERIEYIDKWCRELKILYLQSNLIPKIENVGRLKKLEYINLALNNVEVIENLEGCESLKKLDLTINFVGQLTSIKTLKNLVHLRELYLTGNPCTEYEGYRQYVLGTLPQLKFLDGVEIQKSERIVAVQALPEIHGDILQQQAQHRKKREKEKNESLADERTKSDGRWYTDINTEKGEENGKEKPNDTDIAKTEEEKEKAFWDEKVAFTPESRIKVHQHMEEKRQKDEEKKYLSPDPAPRVRKLQMDDGRRVNINEANIDFELRDNEDTNEMILDVSLYKHLDTSLCDVDVQPNYVQVSVKGKLLQLVLTDEVNPDSSTAKRSEITGHLVITMPKMKQIIRPAAVKPSKKPAEKVKPQPSKNSNRMERLEVDPTLEKTVDLHIVRDPEDYTPKVPLLGSVRAQIPLRQNSPDFVDDDDVPPLM